MHDLSAVVTTVAKRIGQATYTANNMLDPTWNREGKQDRLRDSAGLKAGPVVRPVTWSSRPKLGNIRSPMISQTIRAGMHQRVVRQEATVEHALQQSSGSSACCRLATCSADPAPCGYGTGLSERLCLSSSKRQRTLPEASCSLPVAFLAAEAPSRCHRALLTMPAVWSRLLAAWKAAWESRAQLLWKTCKSFTGAACV